MHKSSHMQIVLDTVIEINKELKFIKLSSKESCRGSKVFVVHFSLTYKKGDEELVTSERGYGIPVYVSDFSGIFNFNPSDKEFTERFNPIFEKFKACIPLLDQIIGELTNQNISFYLSDKWNITFEIEDILPYSSDSKKSFEYNREDYNLNGNTIDGKIKVKSSEKVRCQFSLREFDFSLESSKSSFEDVLIKIKDLRGYLDSLLVSYLEHVLKRTILDLKWIKRKSFNEEYLSSIVNANIDKHKIYAFFYEDQTFYACVYPDGKIPEDKNLKEVLISNEDLQKIRDSDPYIEVPVSIQVFDPETKQFSPPVIKSSWTSNDFLNYLKYFHPF